jgi:sterol 3beta-glucosyltransferase
LPGFAESASEQSVSFLPLTPLSADEVEEWLFRIPRMRGLLRRARAILDVSALRHAERLLGECRAAIDGADVVVGHFMHPVFRMAAEAQGIPYVTGMPQPPTAFGRHWVAGIRRRPAPLGWRLAFAASDGLLYKDINRVRARLGLPALKNVTVEGFLSEALNLVAVSPSVVPPPRGCPSRYRWTGYWFLDPVTPPRVSAALRDFLERGPPPIAISLTTAHQALPGSVEIEQMITGKQAALSRLVVEAVARAGVRAIVYDHWFQWDSAPPPWTTAGAPLPGALFRAGEVPHAWLFPRVAAVVHHGGAGTTAAAIRAGAPAVVVPDGVDQPFWAQVAMKAGVAGPPIPAGELTAERLADAIRNVLDNHTMRDRAKTLGDAVRREDGAGTAVRLVESLIASRGMPRGRAPAHGMVPAPSALSARPAGHE